MSAETLTLMEAARAGDREAAGRLIEENSGLIWSIVRRYHRCQVEMEDLYQLGALGFLKALQGFDPDFGTQFSTYAVPKIAGEIRRFLRDDGPVKVSRGLKERAYAIYRAREALLIDLGREPSLSELAAVTGFTTEDIAAADLANASVASLQAETGENGLSLENLLGSEGPEEGLVEHFDLQRAIEALPERERKIILLRYYKSLTQDKVAKIMGISQVQVSRLEKKAIGVLRAIMDSG